MNAEDRPDRKRDPAAISRPRVSDLLAVLPRIPELSAFLDQLVVGSVADPARRWSGSGELGTVGDRLVDPVAVAGAAERLERLETERLSRLLRAAAAIVEGIAQGDWASATTTLLDQGLHAETAGRAREAEAWYLSACEVARAHGLGLAPRALRLAARTARALGDLDAAAARYEGAWREADAQGLADDVVIAAIGRGNVGVDRGRWDDARGWYERALERIGADAEARRERWQTLQNLAIVRRETGDLGKAREALERAGGEAAQLDDPDAVTDLENGWGQLLLAEGDARGAELHFEAALEAARTPTARLAVAVNLGEALLAQGRSLEAGERAREAEAEAISGSVSHRLPEVYRLLSRVARERGEGEAFVLLERALELVRDRGLPAYEEALTREALGDLRLREGERDLGLGELQRAAEIYERLGAEGARERVARAIGSHGGPPNGTTNPDARAEPSGPTPDMEDRDV